MPGIGLLTDMAYVQMEGKGLAALEMGFPARYTHTPVEACNVADLIQLKDLLLLRCAESQRFSREKVLEDA